MAATTDSPITTFSIGNYLGPLFRTQPTETPVVSIIGGVRGWYPVFAKEFTWQEQDNADASQPAIVEGADPTYTGRTRTETKNVVQIFQYGVNIAYSQMSAVDQLASDAANLLGVQPVQNEVSHQLQLKLELAKTDVEYTVLRGAYQNPTDNNTGRKSRGMENAITTNEIDVSSALAANCTFDVTGHASTLEDVWDSAAHGLSTGDEVYFTVVGAGCTVFVITTRYWVIKYDATSFQLAASLDDAIAGTQVEDTADSTGTWTLRKAARNTKSVVNKLVRTMVASGAKFRMPIFVCGAYNKQRLSDIYGYAPESRTVGGVSIEYLVLDIIGRVGILFDRHMPAGKIFLLDLGLMRLRAMPIKNRGVLFFEPRADTGASEHWQLYGELGLEYGPEEWHGSIVGVTTDEQAA